jgi:alpha-D-ribose 1-methylphosphonate 5-triphosphate synthase subunit PhnL
MSLTKRLERETLDAMWGLGNARFADVHGSRAHRIGVSSPFWRIISRVPKMELVKVTINQVQPFPLYVDEIPASLDT